MTSTAFKANNVHIQREQRAECGSLVGRGGDGR